jgi:hypothetical protein
MLTDARRFCDLGLTPAGAAIAPLLLIASLCIVAGAAIAPLLLIASLCIVAGASMVCFTLVLCDFRGRRDIWAYSGADQRDRRGTSLASLQHDRR